MPAQISDVTVAADQVARILSRIIERSAEYGLPADVVGDAKQALVDLDDAYDRFYGEVG